MDDHQQNAYIIYIPSKIALIIFYVFASHVPRFHLHPISPRFPPGGGPAVFCRGFLNRFFGDPCESGSHEAGVADQLPI